MTPHIRRNSKHKIILKLASAWHTVVGSVRKSVYDGVRVQVSVYQAVRIAKMTLVAVATIHLLYSIDGETSPSIQADEIVMDLRIDQRLKFLTWNARPSWTTEACSSPQGSRGSCREKRGRCQHSTTTQHPNVTSWSSNIASIHTIAQHTCNTPKLLQATQQSHASWSVL